MALAEGQESSKTTLAEELQRNTEYLPLCPSKLSGLLLDE